MFYKTFLFLVTLLFLSGCQKVDSTSNKISFETKYNLIEPATGIYVVIKKDVDEREIKDNFYEKVYFKNNKPFKIERYNSSGNLTDDLSVSAITKFEYNSDGKVKYVKYFDKENKKAVDKKFGYWSIEYIYDEFGRVRMEIYRDANNKFLTVPRDNSGNIAKKDFLAPVLTYEYLGNQLRIKALDKNFNLLKEVLGDKPCVPFIDCGENE